MLACAECPRVSSVNARGWKAFRSDHPEVDEHPRLSFDCPECADAVRRKLRKVGAPRGVRHLPRTRRDHERRGDLASRAAGRWARPLHVRPRRRHPCAAQAAREGRKRGRAPGWRPGRRLPRRAQHGRSNAACSTNNWPDLRGGPNVVRPRRSEDLARPRRQVLAHPHQNRLCERDQVVTDLTRDEDVHRRRMIRAEHLAQR